MIFSRLKNDIRMILATQENHPDNVFPFPRPLTPFPRPDI